MTGQRTRPKVTHREKEKKREEKQTNDKSISTMFVVVAVAVVVSVVVVDFLFFFFSSRFHSILFVDIRYVTFARTIKHETVERIHCLC
jgi:flagellar basal body-associated protein FliL